MVWGPSVRGKKSGGNMVGGQICWRQRDLGQNVLGPKVQAVKKHGVKISGGKSPGVNHLRGNIQGRTVLESKIEGQYQIALKAPTMAFPPSVTKATLNGTVRAGIRARGLYKRLSSLQSL